MTERPALLLRIAPTATTSSTSSTSPKAGGQETRLSADECHATSRHTPLREMTNDDVPGCRLPQAVAATHVHARMIAHARTPGTIPSSRCQTTRRRSFMTATNKCSHGRDVSADWWSQSGSNRRPHACKARALPAELWPLNLTGSRAKQRANEGWWAWEDLNFRPHAYQARALTN
jgi:hypothetical protein